MLKKHTAGFRLKDKQISQSSLHCNEFRRTKQHVRAGRQRTTLCKVSSAVLTLPYTREPYEEPWKSRSRESKQAAIYSLGPTPSTDQQLPGKTISGRRGQQDAKVPVNGTSHFRDDAANGPVTTPLEEELEAPVLKKKAGKRATTGTGRTGTDGKRGKRVEGAAGESLQEDEVADRQARSLSSSASASGRDADEYQATELIFRLERSGEGWGEEIFPHMVIEKRPLCSIQKPPKRNRGSRPDPWEAGSAELFLRDHCCIPEDRVDAVMNTATAWRVTPGGRPLIDRRRRSRVSRNMRLVAEYLENLGVPRGLDGVGEVFMKAPQLMLCKPITNDRWDRRAVELAAYQYHTGHCNVSEDDEELHDLAMWIKRQRMLWQQGSLLQDRMQILGALGFEIGTEAQITKEWEYRFDQLVEWLLLMRSQSSGQDEAGSWLGLDWGVKGGLQGREACLWVQLQRELRSRNLQPADAIRRLDALNFQWELQGGTELQRRWVCQLGRLVYTVERSKKQLDLDRQRSVVAQWRKDGPASVQHEAEAPASAADLLKGQYLRAAQHSGPQDVSANVEHIWLQREVAKRREALMSAFLQPGQAFWLARQKWLWRRGRLTSEQVLLLRLVGLDFDSYSLDEWRLEAHQAAAFLHASHLAPELEAEDEREARQLIGAYMHSDNETKPMGSSHALQTITKPCSVDAPVRQWPPGQRLRVQRWVLTQQALWSERRLSMPQLRYLAVLELSWLLNKEYLDRSHPSWSVQLSILKDHHKGLNAAATMPANEAWLRQQRALHALGWLPEQQTMKLEQAGVQLQPQRSPDDVLWDWRLTELLAFRREHGHCLLPAEGWAAAPELAAWVDEQLALWQRDQLPARRAAQLSAMGLERLPVFDQ